MNKSVKGIFALAKSGVTFTQYYLFKASKFHLFELLFFFNLCEYNIKAIDVTSSVYYIGWSVRNLYEMIYIILCRRNTRLTLWKWATLSRTEFVSCIMGFSGLFKDPLLELHPDGVSVLLSTAILVAGADKGTCSWGSLSLTLPRGDSRLSLNSYWGWNESQDDKSLEVSIKYFSCKIYQYYKKKKKKRGR